MSTKTKKVFSILAVIVVLCACCASVFAAEEIPTGGTTFSIEVREPYVAPSDPVEPPVKPKIPPQTPPADDPVIDPQPVSEPTQPQLPSQPVQEPVSTPETFWDTQVGKVLKVVLYAVLGGVGVFVLIVASAFVAALAGIAVKTDDGREDEDDSNIEEGKFKSFTRKVMNSYIGLIKKMDGRLSAARDRARKMKEAPSEEYLEAWKKTREELGGNTNNEKK